MLVRQWLVAVAAADRWLIAFVLATHAVLVGAALARRLRSRNAR
jgi:hypothetical protein